MMKVLRSRKRYELIKRVSTINCDFDTWILLLNDCSHRLLALQFQHSELLTSAHGQFVKLSCQEDILKAVQVLQVFCPDFWLGLWLHKSSVKHLFLEELLPKISQTSVNFREFLPGAMTMIEDSLKLRVALEVVRSSNGENIIQVDFFSSLHKVFCRMLSLNRSFRLSFPLQIGSVILVFINGGGTWTWWAGWRGSSRFLGCDWGVQEVRNRLNVYGWVILIKMIEKLKDWVIVRVILVETVLFEDVLERGVPFKDLSLKIMSLS